MKSNSSSAPCLIDDGLDDSSDVHQKITSLMVPDRKEQIRCFLATLSDREAWALQEFLLIDECDRGEVIRIGQKYGQDFWGMKDRMDKLRKSCHYTPEEMRWAMLMPGAVDGKVGSEVSLPQVQQQWLHKVRLWLEDHLGIKHD